MRFFDLLPCLWNLTCVRPKIEKFKEAAIRSGETQQSTKTDTAGSVSVTGNFNRFSLTPEMALVGQAAGAFSIWTRRISAGVDAQSSEAVRQSKTSGVSAISNKHDCR